MAEISQSDSFTVPLSPVQARNRVSSWFAQLPHTVVSDSADQIEVKSGSQAKLRLLDGAFIAGSSLPMRTVVVMVPWADSTEVTITARDAAGFGLKAGMNGKFARRLAEVVTRLHEVLAVG